MNRIIYHMNFIATFVSNIYIYLKVFILRYRKRIRGFTFFNRDFMKDCHVKFYKCSVVWTTSNSFKTGTFHSANCINFYRLICTLVQGYNEWMGWGKVGVGVIRPPPSFPNFEKVYTHSGKLMCFYTFII